MGRPSSLHRIAAGQSPNETGTRRKRAGKAPQSGAFMVSVMFTIILATILAGDAARSEEGSTRVTAVAVARAQIVSGVRLSREQVAVDDETPSRVTRLPKPRERPCPEPSEPPCRLIVVDMP